MKDVEEDKLKGEVDEETLKLYKEE